MKIIKLDSSDLDSLDGISKKKGLTRFLWPPFGVSPPQYQTIEQDTKHSQVKLGFPDKE